MSSFCGSWFQTVVEDGISSVESGSVLSGEKGGEVVRGITALLHSLTLQ